MTGGDADLLGEDLARHRRAGVAIDLADVVEIVLEAAVLARLQRVDRGVTAGAERGPRGRRCYFLDVPCR